MKPFLGLSMMSVAARGSAPIVVPAPPGGPIWSALATGAIADPAAWTSFGGAVAIAGGKMVFTAASGSNTLTLTGAYATALTALLAPATNFTVEYVISVWAAGTQGRLRIGNGTLGNYYTISGTGSVSATVLSGNNVGNALVIAGVTGNLCTYTLDDIKIYST